MLSVAQMSGVVCPLLHNNSVKRTAFRGRLLQALGLMLNVRTYPVVLAFALVTATFGVANVLMALWPHICWLPRVGGLLVGVAVFIQGYVGVRHEQFDVPWRWGLTREQAYLHVANVAVVLGTLVWAFGDLLPSVLWVSNGGCSSGQ
jgi:hypothetical protein